MTEINNIPEQLLSLEQFPNDISILIGENGSGKSTLLNTLSKYYLRRQKSVIALANSIHDKFDGGHPNFKTLRGRSGRRQTRLTIKSALQNIAESDNTRLKNVSQALSYVEFDSVIGFKIERLHRDYPEIIGTSNLSDNDKEEASYLLGRALQESRLEEIVWLELESLTFSDLEKSSLTSLFKWETKFKELKILDRIEVFLRKKNVTISMLEASSGELGLITSIIYLATAISEQTVILIDEPENSLHPKWQKEYAKTLMDIFYFYQPKIVIATHSPLVVNGAELFVENSKVFKADNFNFKIQGKEPLNVEELLFRFFDITTPQNRFLSDRVVRLLNTLAGKKITLSDFESAIKKIEESSYDPKQIEVLKAINVIAADIVSNNNRLNDN